MKYYKCIYTKCILIFVGPLISVPVLYFFRFKINLHYCLSINLRMYVSLYIFIQGDYFQDSLILDGCLGLAEGEYSPSNLPQDVTQLLSDNSSLSKICYSPDSFSSSLSKSKKSMIMFLECSLSLINTRRTG